jgi:acyl-CoA thioester hydrolase
MGSGVMGEGTRAPPRLWKETVLPEWLDYNGHLNEAYYVLIFSHATDAFMAEIGLDPTSEERKVNSLYTLETHLCYLDECKAGDRVEVAIRLLGFDAKRYHCFHEMFLGGSDRLLATAEMVLLHVDMSGPRSAPFPEPVRAKLEALWRMHRDLPAPPQRNRAMGLKRPGA